jgi:hypothetical protein
MFDERWFVECELDLAMRRVEIRNAIEIGFSPEVVCNPSLSLLILSSYSHIIHIYAHSAE